MYKDAENDHVGANIFNGKNIRLTSRHYLTKYLQTLSTDCFRRGTE